MALSPSQRIALLKGIAGRLKNDEWSGIDLILKQFSLPWADSWNGQKEDYVLSMLGEAPDEKLIGVADHIGIGVETKLLAPTNPAFWQKGLLRVFLSHLAAHRAMAGQLQEQLLGFGISLFVAHNDIEPTTEWQTEIELALGTCDSLVALLHPGFHASKWTDQEIGFAMGRSVPVFAVRFGQDPYGFIGRFQAFTGLGKTETALALELFNAYRRHAQTQPKMNEVLIQLFEESFSFSIAKARIGFLEEMKIWHPAFVQRIRAAAAKNSQISGSWGVPARVEALAKKWEQSAP